MNTTNHRLKDPIREYWSARAATFDGSPGHCICTDRDMNAYANLIRRHVGLGAGSDVIDLGYGTGEVTRVLARLLAIGIAVHSRRQDDIGRDAAPAAFDLSLAGIDRRRGHSQAMGLSVDENRERRSNHRAEP